MITWWNGSFGDSTEISQDQIRQNATQYLRAGNIVIGHANFPRGDQGVRRHHWADPGPPTATVTPTDVFTAQP